VPDGVDGTSFLPTLRGTAQTAGSPLYWEYHAFGGMQAVRMGDWKGVRLEIRRHDDSPVLLFDLNTDESERHDVASENPEIVSMIREIMDAREPSEIEDWNFARDVERQLN